jgi:hypothetical protein
MSKSARVVTALVVGVAVFIAMVWFDNGVLAPARVAAQANFDYMSFTLLWSLGAIALAGSGLALGALAWWSGSWIVGAVDVLIGGFFALTPVIVLRQGSPAPGWLNNLFIGMGPMSAMILLGAAMLVAGIAAVWRDLSIRRTGAVPRGRSARTR